MPLAIPLMGALFGRALVVGRGRGGTQWHLRCLDCGRGFWRSHATVLRARRHARRIPCPMLCVRSA